MKFSISNINVNNIWRELLIVSDTKEIPKFTNGVITESSGDYETIYYTEGLYQTHKEGETYYNWYLFNSKTVKETGIETLKQEVAELKQDKADFAEALINIQYEQETAKLNIQEG